MKNKNTENTGWFSKKQAKRIGAKIYVSARNGYPVNVTCVGESPPNFDDVVKVGEVGKFIKNSKEFPPRKEINYPTDMTASYSKYIDMTASYSKYIDMQPNGTAAIDAALFTYL